MLRCLARRRRDDPITENESKRLYSWLARMERDGTVVVYDPEVGFAYGLRSPDDPPDLPIHPVEVKIS